MIKKLLTFAVLLSGFASLSGQEVVIGLSSNPMVKKAWINRDMKKHLTVADTAELPFFDDFSTSDIFPDPGKWQDDYVFINNSYSVKQRTQGMATFDALDNTGSLYADASTAGFEADHLTSQPINLNYTPADSIYLSFLYEPGGLAVKPLISDSLTLQFYAPAESKWYSVWRAPDISADTFRTAIINIGDPKFLMKGFMFRFINYATLSQLTGDPAMMGNTDQWNLDYVLLGKNRNSADTLFRDVAFTLPVRSVLKTYESVPWKQFRQFFLSEMGPWVTIHYFNNDSLTRNVTRDFEIFDMYKGIPAYTFSGGAANIPAFSPVTYQGTLIYTFNTDNTDSALFRIKSWLTTDLFDPKQNDTIIYYQKFGNYYCFDDGTAEAGYGINGLGSRDAMVAYRYDLQAPDTLRAVQICFNQSYQNANITSFNLMVWDDNGGLPGNVLRTETDLSVQQGPGLNGFQTYYLADPVEVTNTYYVGWQQTTEKFMNAGFDLNTPNTGRQLYFLNGTWNTSQASGSLMIRPVFGPRQSSTGIEDIFTRPKLLRFWPNPASDKIIIEKSDEDEVIAPVIVIKDLQGRELVRTFSYSPIDISALSPGVYIIIKYTGVRPTGYGRLVKSR